MKVKGEVKVEILLIFIPDLRFPKKITLKGKISITRDKGTAVPGKATPNTGRPADHPW